MALLWMWWDRLQYLSPLATLQLSKYIFVVVTALAVDCLLGVGYLVAHGVIIDYDRGCVVIEDKKPFTLPNGVTTTNLDTCDRVISVRDTTTIPSHMVQLVDVSLPDAAKLLGLSNILVEPAIVANTPKHVLFARTCSPVFNNNHAVVQVMNISPTTVTIYRGTKLGEFIPLMELQLVESQQQQAYQPPSSPCWTLI